MWGPCSRHDTCQETHQLQQHQLALLGVSHLISIPKTSITFARITVSYKQPSKLPPVSSGVANSEDVSTMTKQQWSLQACCCPLFKTAIGRISRANLVTSVWWPAKMPEDVSNQVQGARHQHLHACRWQNWSHISRHCKIVTTLLSHRQTPLAINGEELTTTQKQKPPAPASAQCARLPHAALCQCSTTARQIINVQCARLPHAALCQCSTTARRIQMMTRSGGRAPACAGRAAGARSPAGIQQ